MKKNIFPEVCLFEEDANVYVSKNNFKNFKNHSHEFYEFEYFFEGSGVCEINGKEYPFKKGDISFVTPLDIHGYSSESNVRTLTIHFRPANFSRIFLGITNINACLINSTEELRNAFNILINQNKNNEFYEVLCEKTVETILLLFLQIKKANKKDVLPKEINAAIEYINLNFKNNINLKTVSDYAGYSQEYFSRQFKKYMGTGFLNYLTELRVTYAKHLLDNQEITVTQACYECGFGCLRSFRRAFNKKYGYSPNDFRCQKLSL